MNRSFLSPDIESALGVHGIQGSIYLAVFDAPSCLPTLTSIFGAERVHVPESVEDAARAVRSHRLAAIVTSPGSLSAVVRALGNDSTSVSVIVVPTSGESPSTAMLKAAGAMDVAADQSEQTLVPLLRRALDFRALLSIELTHRCESKRLLNRELELLGHPPENMSDDLETCQPPPLPVGPLSTYSLDEASDAFERAYIERVQHLCASAREAAVYLGVSSATLSRRLRREGAFDGA